MKVSLEVGKSYKRANGDIRTIESNEDSTTYPFKDENGTTYQSDGRRYKWEKDLLLDLVEEVHVFKAVPDGYHSFDSPLDYLSVEQVNRDLGEDPVNSPSHYTTGKIEVIDFITDKDLDFSLGNAVKYIVRARHKGRELEDLKKAKWYIERAIKDLEEKK